MTRSQRAATARAVAHARAGTIPRHERGWTVPVLLAATSLVSIVAFPPLAVLAAVGALVSMPHPPMTDHCRDHAAQLMKEH